MSTLLSPTYAAIRADMLRTRRWSAVWITIGAWLLLNAVFGYVFDYITYSSGSSSFSNEGDSRAAIIARLLPSGVPDNLPQGMPLFGGALMMVLGALLAGSGYGWGTWKTAFTQGPSRIATTLGSLASLLTVVAGVVAATLALDFAFALGIAGLESRHVVWPSLGHTAQMAGVAYLVMAMWAMVGYLLGTLARGPALSVGLGLVWTLVIENLLRGVGESLSAVATFTHFLPGTAAGSLIGRLLPADQLNSPGLFTTLATPQALVTVIAYLVLAPVLAIVLVRRRDVA